MVYTAVLILRIWSLTYVLKSLIESTTLSWFNLFSSRYFSYSMLFCWAVLYFTWSIRVFSNSWFSSMVLWICYMFVFNVAMWSFCWVFSVVSCSSFLSWTSFKTSEWFFSEAIAAVAWSDCSWMLVFISPIVCYKALLLLLTKSIVSLSYFLNSSIYSHLSLMTFFISSMLLYFSFSCMYSMASFS